MVLALVSLVERQGKGVCERLLRSPSRVSTLSPPLGNVIHMLPYFIDSFHVEYIPYVATGTTLVVQVKVSISV